MAEYKETHMVKEQDGSSSGGTPWLAFAVGALLIALVAFFFLNARGTFSVTPSGTKAEFSTQSPAAPAPAASPAPAAAPARP